MDRAAHGRGGGSANRGVRIGCPPERTGAAAMQPRAQAAFPAAFPEISAFMQHLFVYCLDVQAVWLLDAASSQRRHELLVVADRPTLERLRAATDLHRADLDVLVVIDGDAFESAWGLRKVSGSLGRWAW